MAKSKANILLFIHKIQNFIWSKYMSLIKKEAKRLIYDLLAALNALPGLVCLALFPRLCVLSSMVIVSCVTEDHSMQGGYNNDTVLMPVVDPSVTLRGNEMSIGQKIRIASFNVSMEAGNYLPSDAPGLSADVLMAVLDNKEHLQVRNIAEIIQRVRPHILLLNEFDYIAELDKGIQKFQRNFLGRSQNGQLPIQYLYMYLAPFNTGVLSGHDINGDGMQGLPHDAYGYGFYPGQYGMVLLSQYPIDDSAVRTFQRFKWADMPGALAPVLEDKTPFYAKEVWEQLRLSSKSHWDIPLIIGDTTLHILASHPTPPVFDGVENANGRRNHDEIRFWRDYIDVNSQKAAYIYDDKHVTGGLSQYERFVILGDLNASPHSDAAIVEGIIGLLKHERVSRFNAPTSEGGQQNKSDDPLAAEHTAYWGARADYVIPSKSGLKIRDTGIFWPAAHSPLARLVQDRQSSSDHRLVWMDLEMTDKDH